MKHTKQHKMIHGPGKRPKRVKVTWRTLLVAGVAIVLIIAVFAQLNSREGEGYEEFAQCISDAGAVMYGAEWCSHCKAQKRDFGDAFSLVNYVECPENAETCTSEGIKGYPTWIIDGQHYEGRQPMQLLAELTGCSLPS